MTQLNAEVEMLRRIPLFSRIEPSKLKLLAFTSEHMTFQDGQTLMQQGEVGNEAYVLMEGSVAVSVDEITVAKLGDNALVGEIAILCDAPRMASVRALGEVKTLLIRKEQFLQLVSQFPQMGIEIIRSVAGRLDVTNRKLAAANLELEEAKRKLAEAKRNQGAA